MSEILSTAPVKITREKFVLLCEGLKEAASRLVRPLTDHSTVWGSVDLLMLRSLLTSLNNILMAAPFTTECHLHCWLSQFVAQTTSTHFYL